MTWQVTIVLCVFFAISFTAMEYCGVFELARKNINPPEPTVPARTPIDRLEFDNVKNDVDKIKLALNIKEFKSK
jgi:hypothetical protein